nr:murein transglycosylase A [Rhodovulum imhoffii]
MRGTVLSLCLAAGPGNCGTATLLGYADLNGWAKDDHAAALRTFVRTCADVRRPGWEQVCRQAEDEPNPRAFFELFFRPVQIDGSRPALFTGYYEPVLEGARARTERFGFPIYRAPAELAGNRPWLTRKEIDETGALEGRGLELAWLEDPVDVFFLQVQGSGRIRLRDGSLLRVAYADRNGHPYRSIGKEMIRRDIYKSHQVSMRMIREWVRQNPGEGRELLHHDPSFVFFRAIDLPPDLGPVGAMNRPLTPLRSVAVDPGVIPLGSPVWIEKAGKSPLARLMVAQDTGAAVKGEQRADIFFGTGGAAGRAAAHVRDGGRLVVLLPLADAMAALAEHRP